MNRALILDAVAGLLMTVVGAVSLFLVAVMVAPS